MISNQGDEEATDSTVPIKKRVNGFELIVASAMVTKGGRSIHAGTLARPRDRTRLLPEGDAGSDRATGLANPVLNLTKTAGRSWVPLDTVSSRISYNRQQ